MTMTACGPRSTPGIARATLRSWRQTAAPGIPASHMYFLNTDNLFFRYAPKRMFMPLDRIQSLNQDAIVQLVTFAGNLTGSNFALQGVLKA